MVSLPRGRVKKRIIYFVFLHEIECMRIDIITVLPEILEGPFNHSIVKRAREKEIVEIRIHNLRDFSSDQIGRAHV